MARTLIVLSIIAVTSIQFSAADTDYCQIRSCSRKIHVACAYKTSVVSYQCAGLLDSGVSEKQKKQILDRHNALRRLVASGNETRGYPGPQPAARDLKDLQWDDELELLAQRWANQCLWTVDRCRDVERFRVGQNVAYITDDEPDNFFVDSMINLWYGEIDRFPNKEVTRFRGIMNGYAQIVWANTTYIGCGSVKYKLDTIYVFFLVCNYGPRGALRGLPLYTPVKHA